MYDRRDDLVSRFLKIIYLVETVFDGLSFTVSYGNRIILHKISCQ